MFIASKILLNKKIKTYPKDEITLVTALFRMKSKFTIYMYLSWVSNLLLLNRSIVFFVDKKISRIIKKKRPKLYENKTVWIESSIKDFYVYKNYRKNFIESHKIDLEKSYHTIPLYMVWAEKCAFIKKAIYFNYFNSKCFYWIDAGFFREKNMEDKYINKWPSVRKCYEDPRVIINSIRELSYEEIKALKNFNTTILNNIIKKMNVAGGFFGGKSQYLIKFCDLYYNAIKIFIKHKIFIGKDQNLFTYVSYLNPKIVKIVHSHKVQDWYYFKYYFFE